MDMFTRTNGASSAVPVPDAPLQLSPSSSSQSPLAITTTTAPLRLSTSSSSAQAAIASTSSASSSSASRDVRSVEEFFGSLDLAELVTIFVSNGFDSMQSLYDVQEMDLEAMAIKRGHRRTIQRALAASRGVPDTAKLQIDQNSSISGTAVNPRPPQASSPTFNNDNAPLTSSPTPPPHSSNSNSGVDCNMSSSSSAGGLKDGHHHHSPPQQQQQHNNPPNLNPIHSSSLIPELSSIQQFQSFPAWHPQLTPQSALIHLHHNNHNHNPLAASAFHQQQLPAALGGLITPQQQQQYLQALATAGNNRSSTSTSSINGNGVGVGVGSMGFMIDPFTGNVIATPSSSSGNATSLNGMSTPTVSGAGTTVDQGSSSQGGKQQQQQQQQVSATGKRKYVRRPKPDLNMPEKPISAYLVFSNELRAKHEGISFAELTKMTATLWKNMEPEEREQREDEAAAKKKAYRSALMAYKKTAEYEAYQTYLREFNEKHNNNNNKQGFSSSSSPPATVSSSPPISRSRLGSPGSLPNTSSHPHSHQPYPYPARPARSNLNQLTSGSSSPEPPPPTTTTIENQVAECSSNGGDQNNNNNEMNVDRVLEALSHHRRNDSSGVGGDHGTNDNDNGSNSDNIDPAISAALLRQAAEDQRKRELASFQQHFSSLKSLDLLSRHQHHQQQQR